MDKSKKINKIKKAATTLLCASTVALYCCGISSSAAVINNDTYQAWELKTSQTSSTSKTTITRKKQAKITSLYNSKNSTDGAYLILYYSQPGEPWKEFSRCYADPGNKSYQTSYKKIRGEAAVWKGTMRSWWDNKKGCRADGAFNTK